MRYLMESVKLMESEFTPAIDAVLAKFVPLYGELTAAFEAEARAFGTKLSTEWPGCIVAVYQAQSMPAVKILISDQMLGRAKGSDDYYDEVRQAIMKIDDNNAIVNLNLALDNEHRNAISDFEFCFRDGRQITWEEYMARDRELRKVNWGSNL